LLTRPLLCSRSCTRASQAAGEDGRGALPFAATAIAELHGLLFEASEKASGFTGAPPAAAAAASGEGAGLCDRQTFARWVDAVSAGYHNGNPYHNSWHAADVAATANGFLQHSGAFARYDNCFSSGRSSSSSSSRGVEGVAAAATAEAKRLLASWRVGRFALLLASCAHDVGHPARTGAFVEATKGSLLASLGPGSSLEAMHAETFSSVCKRPGHDVLGSPALGTLVARRQARELVVTLILATDLGKQRDILGRFNGFKLGDRSGDSSGGGSSGKVCHRTRWELIICFLRAFFFFGGGVGG